MLGNTLNPNTIELTEVDDPQIYNVAGFENEQNNAKDMSSSRRSNNFLFQSPVSKNLIPCETIRLRQQHEDMQIS